MSHYVYILRCSDSSYYVGSSENVAARVEVHNQGSGSSYTKQRRPVVLIYSEECENKNAALRRERQIKKWSRDKKEALIANDRVKLKRLAQSHRK